jgi:hypothetical protein
MPGWQQQAGHPKARAVLRRLPVLGDVPRRAVIRIEDNLREGLADNSRCSGAASRGFRLEKEAGDRAAGAAVGNRAVREVLTMHYKPKSVAAVHVALAGLPDKMPVEVDPDIEVTARTVGELREVTVWPDNCAIATPQDRDPQNPVRVSKASHATRTTPKP